MLALADTWKRVEEATAFGDDVLLEALTGQAADHREELAGQAALERHEREALVELTGIVEPREKLNPRRKKRRQALFAHHNTRHALEMGRAAGGYAATGADDQTGWATVRERFRGHVVED